MKTVKINQIGLRIKNIRKELGMTQIAFAQAIRCPYNTYISRWENGLSEPNARYMRAIIALDRRHKYKKLNKSIEGQSLTHSKIEIKLEPYKPVARSLKVQPKQTTSFKTGNKIDKIENVELGLRIKMIRINLKINQKRFAGAIGVTTSTLSNWETGMNKPKYQSINRMAALVGIHPNELLYGRLEEFVFKYVGNPKCTLYPDATNDDLIKIIDKMSKEPKPYELETLTAIVREYRYGFKTTSILPGYFS